MKHFLLKFNHGVEIGARLAYLGHFMRTRDQKIWTIAHDELIHMRMLESMLYQLGEFKSSEIDAIFRIIGYFVGWACKWAPLWSLNFVASTMEIFAIFNYKRLALKYPQFSDHFVDMAKTETDHQRYFSRKS